MMKYLSVLLLVFSSYAIADEETKDLPNTLFGIALGMKAIFKQGDNVGNLPVKKFTGMTRFAGNGLHYYFEPLNTSEEFPFYEFEEEGSAGLNRSNYRLFLMPIIPDDVHNLTEMNAKFAQDGYKSTVTVIEFQSTDYGDEMSAYHAANKRCDALNAEYEKPFAKNYKKAYWEGEVGPRRTCSIEQGNREMEIGFFGGGTYRYSLKLLHAEIEAMDNEVTNRLQTLQANETKVEDSKQSNEDTTPTDS